MLFKSAENRCLLNILKILEKGDAKYSQFFKETKFSHTTIQRVLKYLESKKFIERKEKGYKEVDYVVTKKGRELLKQLEEFKRIL